MLFVSIQILHSSLTMASVPGAFSRAAVASPHGIPCSALGGPCNFQGAAHLQITKDEEDWILDNLLPMQDDESLAVTREQPLPVDQGAAFCRASYLRACAATGISISSVLEALGQGGVVIACALWITQRCGARPAAKPSACLLHARLCNREWSSWNRQVKYVAVRG
jgi:hypothetical protein